jgi:hypothetical protein
VETNGTGPTASRTAMTRRRARRLAAPLAVVVALWLAAAACGGGRPSASVASVGSKSKTTTSGQSSPPEAGSSATSYADRLKHAECMRAHGIPDFPDPNQNGATLLRGGPGSDLNASDPRFQAAETACQKLLPNGGQPTPAEQIPASVELLKFSQCMRAHGIADFPDPVQVNGYPGFTFRPSGDLNPDNPKFQAAQGACQKFMPPPP